MRFNESCETAVVLSRAIIRAASAVERRESVGRQFAVTCRENGAKKMAKFVGTFEVMRQGSYRSQITKLASGAENRANLVQIVVQTSVQIFVQIGLQKKMRQCRYICRNRADAGAEKGVEGNKNATLVL